MKSAETGDRFRNDLHYLKVTWKGILRTELPTTISETFKHEKMDTEQFPNITTLLKVAAMFPVTSCECERSFSSLHYLKTFNR